LARSLWALPAEETLTSDTVPVNVAAQLTACDIIGRTTLTELPRRRERIEDELQRLIDQRSNPWGVTVSSVEMRDVVIPGALQDAMSREAQAAREKQARIPRRPHRPSPVRDEQALLTPRAFGPVP
jgi:regulator of protease activity HflC (stomatin/prohibitin superfamily)